MARSRKKKETRRRGLGAWLGRLRRRGFKCVRWSPGVHVLLLARLVDGFAIGLAVTLVPVYISEVGLAMGQGPAAGGRIRSPFG
jgi:hypothetical protein